MQTRTLHLEMLRSPAGAQSSAAKWHLWLKGCLLAWVTCYHMGPEVMNHPLLSQGLPVRAFRELSGNSTTTTDTLRNSRVVV